MAAGRSKEFFGTVMGSEMGMKIVTEMGTERSTVDWDRY